MTVGEPSHEFRLNAKTGGASANRHDAKDAKTVLGFTLPLHRAAIFGSLCCSQPVMMANPMRRNAENLMAVFMAFLRIERQTSIGSRPCLD